MSASECQVLGYLWGNRLCKISSLNLQRWNWLWFCRVSTVSDWAKFAVQIPKDEAWMPLLTVGAFVYFCASIVCPSRNFENSQRLLNSTELRTKDIARSSKQ